MIDSIQKNIELQIGMLREISNCTNRLPGSQAGEKEILEKSIDSLNESIRIISNNLPQMIQKVSIAPPLTEVKNLNLERVEVKFNGRNEQVTLDKKSKKRLLEELRIGQEFIKKLKKEDKVVEENEESGALRSFYKASNKIFSGTSRSMMVQGYFDDLKSNLKKANMNILLEGYISMMLMTSTVIFIISSFIFAYFLFFNFSASFPFISMHAESFFTRIIKIFWIPIIAPILTFLFLYWYPSGEKKSIERRIDQELPFAVVHMSAVSGSGVEPIAIFRIIAMGKEYPYLRKEVRKILNQINLYGYDIITALNNAAKNSPSKRLSELLTGIAITINSGGNLSDFFEKRSESLINEYSLSREKYTKVAETSMDLYITVVIAAPMVLLLVFILLSINPELGVSISPQLMTIILILAIS